MGRRALNSGIVKGTFRGSFWLGLGRRVGSMNFWIYEFPRPRCVGGIKLSRRLLTLSHTASESHSLSLSLFRPILLLQEMFSALWDPILPCWRSLCKLISLFSTLYVSLQPICITLYLSLSHTQGTTSASVRNSVYLALPFLAFILMRKRSSSSSSSGYS